MSTAQPMTDEEIEHLVLECESCPLDLDGEDPLAVAWRRIHRLVAEVQRQRGALDEVRADRDGWKSAAESQNRQWSRKCLEFTEVRAEQETVRDEARARIAALETALRDLAESRMSRIETETRWCLHCGATWGTQHVATCPTGRALRVLGSALATAARERDAARTHSGAPERS